MKRTLNWTDRVSIPLEAITLRIVAPTAPGQPQSFTAEVEGLTRLKLKPEAQIYIEPYVGYSSMRFDLGTVSNPKVPPDTALNELDMGTGVLFRVKVVDESVEIGKILAAANAIRPSNEIEEDDRKALLPVAFKDLGEAIWVVDVQPGARPQLILNNLIPGLGDLLRNNPLLQGSIVPHAVRKVLQAVFVESEGDEEAEWIKEWKTFATAVRGEEIEEDTEDEELERILDEIVARFIAQTKWVTRFKQQQVTIAGKIDE
jgi:hypothetical protein